MGTPDERIAELRNAIAALEAQRAVLGDALVNAALEPMREKLVVLEAATAPEAQRKLATVLFADVSGFTALSEMMDAEVVAGIMNDLWALVDGAIVSHRGRIDKHIGDAVMAIWGTDEAQEDDPEMAVRAALDMQAAVDAFCTTHSAPVSLRIGLNTGMVLLGSVGTTSEFTAIGDAVNLASRLEQAAPAGGVLISSDTYRHIRGLFEVEPQKPLLVKGKTEPVQTYIVVRALPRGFRKARGVEGIETRMIGRDRELGMLQDAYADAAEARETRLVTVVGEAGVGKSRLLFEFDQWLSLPPERVYRGRAIPTARHVSLGLFRDLFAARFDILDSDPTAVVQRKFRDGLSGVLEPVQVDILGQWLGFDFSSSEVVARLFGGAGIREMGRAYLFRAFQNLAADEPLVVMLEDIHWADDPSLDLAAELVETLDEARLLVVAAARPALYERRPNWGEGHHAYLRVNLSPLSRRATASLVQEILQRVGDLPDALKTLIIDAAEGNPFYVEELVKMLIGQGVIVRDGPLTADPRPQITVLASLATDQSPLVTEKWTVRTDRLEGLKVPPTLTGLLQARLDALPRPEREALQRASIIGRRFWDDAVADLLDAEVSSVDQTLQAARGRELIFRREHSSFAHAGEYIFKHTLLRDVTYETVLLKHRGEFHGRVARWLEAHAGDRLDEFQELIAEHYIQAGEWQKAATLLEHAARQFIQIGFYRPARDGLERARALRESSPEETDVGTLARLYESLAEVYTRLGNLEAGEKWAEQALLLGRQTGDAYVEAMSLAHLVMVYRFQGRYERMDPLIGAMLRAGEAAGGEAEVRTLVVSGYRALDAADADMAELRARKVLSIAQASGDVALEVEGWHLLSMGTVARGETTAAKVYLQQTIELAREISHLSYIARSLVGIGYASYLDGDYTTARDAYREAIDRYRELGEEDQVIFNEGNLAQALVALGETAEARPLVDRLLAISRDEGKTPNLLFGLFVVGQLQRVEGDLDRALAIFGLLRGQPALDFQVARELDDELAALGQPTEQLQAGLAAGAALDLATVVQEVLDGEW